MPTSCRRVARSACWLAASGRAAIITSQLYSPGHIVVIDPADARRKAATDLGATALDPDSDDPVEVVQAMTGGMGADVAMEAVGVPETFELCTRLIRPGGHVANIGVHGQPATLHLETLWIRNVTITTGLVDTNSTPTLIGLLATGKLDVSSFLTHRFALSEIMQAYEVFADPQRTEALKVLLTAP